MGICSETIPGMAVVCSKALSFLPLLIALFQDDFKVSHLTDNQGDTYWESSGSPGQHWVRLHMKKGSVIK